MFYSLHHPSLGSGVSSPQSWSELAGVSKTICVSATLPLPGRHPSRERRPRGEAVWGQRGGGGGGGPGGDKVRGSARLRCRAACQRKQITAAGSALRISLLSHRSSIFINETRWPARTCCSSAATQSTAQHGHRRRPHSSSDCCSNTPKLHRMNNVESLIAWKCVRRKFMFLVQERVNYIMGGITT